MVNETLKIPFTPYKHMDIPNVQFPEAMKKGREMEEEVEKEEVEEREMSKQMQLTQ